MCIHAHILQPLMHIIKLQQIYIIYSLSNKSCHSVTEMCRIFNASRKKMCSTFFSTFSWHASWIDNDPKITQHMVVSNNLLPNSFSFACIFQLQKVWTTFSHIVSSWPDGNECVAVLNIINETDPTCIRLFYLFFPDCWLCSGNIFDQTWYLSRPSRPAVV